MKVQTFTATYADGTVVTVTTDGRDWAAYDLTRGARKWPPFQEGLSIWRPFLVWNARRREDPASVGRSFDMATDIPVSLDEVEGDGTPPLSETV